jgi:uncharacterized membrane-anchored protein
MGARGRKRTTGTTGPLRVDTHASRLAARARPGDIVVLDQVDLDAAVAQRLVARRVAAVVNASPSTSGRYPNAGPALLVEAGVPLVDDVGASVLTLLRDGSEARLEDDTLWVDDAQVARGMRQDPETVALATQLARGGLAAQLADVAGGAVGFLLDEKALLLEGTGIPAYRTKVTGRHALLVGPAYGGQADLRRLRRYRRRCKPLLVGVDGGVDVLLASGMRPDLAVGDPETMSDEALRAAGELVLREGAEGWDRVHDLAVPALSCASRAASEDLALLLLQRGGAEVVVGAGLPRDFEELLDRGRAAAASTLVTRAGATTRFVHAEAVLALEPPRRRGLALLAVVLAAALAASVALGHEEILSAWRDLVG